MPVAALFACAALALFTACAGTSTPAATAGRSVAGSAPTARFIPVSPDATELFAPHLVAGLTQAPPALDGALADPPWAAVPPRPFFNTRTGAAPDAPTGLRVAYDGTHLYLALAAYEKGQETQRHAVTERDSNAIFETDGIEVFLQPGGTGTPYYQVVANTSGSLWDQYWQAPGQPEPWDSPGTRASGQVQADTWTLELAVPFADLGVQPRPGDAWRFNACRTEHPSGEYTCWSPTRGGYHLPERFGYLEFGSVPDETAAIEATSRAGGIVLEEGGQPAPGVAVRTAFGTARTDSQGAFVLTDLPRGGATRQEVALRIDSPRYQTWTATFAVDDPVESLPPIRLTRRDPYRPAYRLTAGRVAKRRAVGHALGGQPVTWLSSSLEEPPDMQRAPGPDALLTSLDLLATPGEYESAAVALYAHRDLRAPMATLSDLRGPDGVEPNTAEVRWTQRLLKRIQYTRDPEEAVFTWRYLWREAPEWIRADHLRQLVVTVHVPDGAAPGTYTGELELSSAGDLVASLPVRLEVAPFVLAEPEKRVGAYYRGHRLPDDQVRLELDDLYEHGSRVLVWHAGLWYGRGDDGQITYDTEAVERAVRLQQEFGIGPPYLVGTNPRRASALAGLKVAMSPAYAAALDTSREFRRIYGEGIRRLHALEEELGAGEFLFTWMDEVFGRGRFEPWMAMARITRELSDHRIYITMHNRDQSLVDKADPYVDVRGYHGHTLDWWQDPNQDRDGHTFDDLERELDAAGDEAWTYYNIRGTEVTAEWVRLCNGYWLWRSPLAAHTPWIYYAFGNSAFDDLDSPRHDFAYAAPHPDQPEMVSTLEWEAFREGWDDLRYLTTLERAIDRAGLVAPGSERVNMAREMLRTWWDEDPRVPVQAQALSAADYRWRKRAMARAISGLHELID